MVSKEHGCAQYYTTQWLPGVAMPLANKFYRQHGFRGKAKRNQPCAVVKNARDEIVACGYLRDYDTFNLLAGVAVSPGYQGQGLARLLLEFITQRCDQRSYTFPYLPLVALYQSLGFTAVELDPQSAVFDLYHVYLKQRRSIIPMCFG